MHLNLVFLFSFFLSGSALLGQGVLKGIVVDAGSGAPLPGASVFLNNTSVGTATDNNGRFELPIPSGRFELVVSSVGYATHVQDIGSTAPDVALKVRLSWKARELETVVIEPWEKDGWEKWGRFFTEKFIGTSAYADDCRILNKEVLRFRNSRTGNQFSAMATGPLIIENRALGYRIHYQLEAFVYDYKTRRLTYLGYPRFEPMKGMERQEKRWEVRRREVYYGSLLHFMRALFRNRLRSEGFDLRHVKKEVNEEKERVRAARQAGFKRVVQPNGTVLMQDTLDRDSSAYYARIMEEPDYYDLASPLPLSGEDVAYAIDSATAGFHFTDYLMVSYNKGRPPADYVRQQLAGLQRIDGRRRPEEGEVSMSSQLLLPNGTIIEVQQNGSYYPPTDLLSLGFWSWSEKIATLLPFDYWPDR